MAKKNTSRDQAIEALNEVQAGKMQAAKSDPEQLATAAVEKAKREQWSQGGGGGDPRAE